MTLKDKIDVSITAGYEIFFGNFPDPPYYSARYLPYSGGGTYRSFGLEDEIYGTILNPVSEDGKTFSVTFEVDNTDNFELWGYSFEYSWDKIDYWVDYIPTEYEPDMDISEDNDTSGGDDDDDEVNETSDDDDDYDNNNETVDGDNNSNISDDDKISNDEENGTPGFELFGLICAIFYIIHRKSKR
jgi:hypothetical protein